LFVHEKQVSSFRVEIQGKYEEIRFLKEIVKAKDELIADAYVVKAKLQKELD